MIVYVDTSFMLSIYLQEPQRHDAARSVLAVAERIVCSAMGIVEVRAGLARARFRENPPRLSRSEYDRAHVDFVGDWERIFSVALSDDLLLLASQLAETHRLRAYDAVHLASSLAFSALVSDVVTMATWDIDLANSAVAEGLSVAHEVIS